jgi:hypothetical protein
VFSLICRDRIVARNAEQLAVVSGELPRLVDLHSVHDFVVDLKLAADRAAALATRLAVLALGARALDDLDRDGAGEIAALHAGTCIQS